MPTITNKQRQLTHLFSALKKRYEPAEPPPLPVLEQFLYAICREGATRARADEVFRLLKERFFDWNEIRVSSVREIDEVFEDYRDADVRAQRLIDLLQEVFEMTFSFELESLQKKGLKEAAKKLARYKAANDYAVAWVVQRSLGGHAIPLDAPTVRVLRRLGVLDGEQQDIETMRASLEHLIPKSKGPLFNELLSELAEELCHEEEPKCSDCPLRGDCPSAQTAVSVLATAERGMRSKPR
ncbi:MAG: endonuclease [Gemmataceae bacterium]